MKKLIQTSLSIVLLAASSTAAADLNRSQLDQISRSERSWQGANAQSQGFQENIGVYITDQNGLRFAQIPTSFHSTGEIDKPSLKHQNDKILRDWCTNMKLGFKYAKTQKAAYSLSLHVNPFSSLGFLSVDGGQPRPMTDVENAVKLVDIIPRLELSADSNSVLDTSFNKADFEKVIRQQLTTQRDAIASTGDAILDLTGWDDVACDLIQNNGTLKFALNVMYDSALVTRQPVISGDELQQVYSGIRPYWKDQSGTVRNLIIGGALLGGSMVSQLHKSPTDFGATNFIGVFAQLFEVRSGKLKNLTASDMNGLASGLDQLSRGSSVSTPILQQLVSVKTR
jgi:hypothetical protein